MFSVNYALQKLVTDDRISLDARIIDFLGTGFAEDTMIVPNEKGETPQVDLEEIKKWKTEVTIRDLLRHQGGFPADMALDSLKLIPEDLNARARQAGTHPSIRNAQSKYELFEHMAGKCEDQAMTTALRDSLRTVFEKAHVTLP